MNASSYNKTKATQTTNASYHPDEDQPRQRSAYVGVDYSDANKHGCVRLDLQHPAIKPAADAVHRTKAKSLSVRGICACGSVDETPGSAHARLDYCYSICVGKKKQRKSIGERYGPHNSRLRSGTLGCRKQTQQTPHEHTRLHCRIYQHQPQFEACGRPLLLFDIRRQQQMTHTEM